MLSVSNAKTEPETPTVTLMYSGADDGLEWETRLFRRFQDEFYLTRRELRSQDTRRLQPGEFRIEPAEYFDVVNSLRQLSVPVVPREDSLRLGPFTKLSICTEASDVTFRWARIRAIGNRWQLSWKKSCAFGGSTLMNTTEQHEPALQPPRPTSAPVSLS